MPNVIPIDQNNTELLFSDAANVPQPQFNTPTVQGWVTKENGRTRIMATGKPEPAQRPSRVQQLEEATSYWDEPAQATNNPNFQNFYERAVKDLQLKFSRMPNASLSDAQRAIDETVAPYLPYAPELRGAIKQAFRDRLPGRAGTELARVRRDYDLYDRSRLVQEIQDEAMQGQPGYTRDPRTGRMTPIAETPTQKREREIEQEQTRIRVSRDSQLNHAKALQRENPNYAIYDTGDLASPKLRVLDRTSGQVPDPDWTLVKEAPALMEEEERKSESKAKIWPWIKELFRASPPVITEAGKDLKMSETLTGRGVRKAVGAPEPVMQKKRYRTARNPNTGETFVLINGQWVSTNE